MKIFVGNLNYRTSEESLSKLFSQFGQVFSVVVVRDRFTEQSKGFAFLEMENENAQSAIDSLNGTELDGRLLRINEAKK